MFALKNTWILKIPSTLPVPDNFVKILSILYSYNQALNIQFRNLICNCEFIIKYLIINQENEFNKILIMMIGFS